MDQVEQIREKTDLVALISESVPLKKLGRNFKTKCPFHNEKTPSFVVSPERQIWRCFGCGKGGDCFSWLMEYERMEFPEALRVLAKKTGIELAQYKFETGISSQKEKIFKLNFLACEFYHYLLTKHEAGKAALQYLVEQRNIKPATIETFMLGFAPNQVNALSNYLISKKNYKAEDLLEAGLSSLRQGKPVDFFQNRLIFPLFDHRKNIIGFSGRVLDEQNSFGGKYINTRETLVYHKGSVFFGLNSAKENIKKQNKAVIMEGELDVISSFQQGIDNCVAIKGTALTEDQVALISRFAQNISLCFDMDSAGEAATKRSLPILEKHNLNVSVIVLGNKDPDEAIKTDPIAFKKAIKKNLGIYDFLFQKTVEKFGKATIEAKEAIAADLLPIFAQIQNEIVKEHFLRKLSLEIETSYETLLKEINRLEKKEVVKKPIVTAKTSRPRRELLEEYLLALILQADDPQSILHKLPAALGKYSFAKPALAKLLQFLTDYLNKHNFEPLLFAKSLAEELRDAFDLCYLLPLTKFATAEKYQQEANKIAEELYSSALREQIKTLGLRISQAETAGKLAEMEALQIQLKELIAILPKSQV